MAEITVTAETGRPTGSRASGRLRSEGKVPGVVYGLGQDPVTVGVPWRELRHALTGEAALNALIDLRFDGHAELVMVKELQRHPVRRNVLHVDFLRVSRDQELTVDVPVTLVGEASAVLDVDGVVEQVLFAVAITAKPQSIPNELMLDISHLAPGDTLRVSDLPMPAGVVAASDPDEPVVATSVGSATEAAEGEAEGEAAEGEAGTGEGADGEGGDESGGASADNQ
jgi:large subunit ribosomal protein L25